MESKSLMRNDIYKILDEIIELNDSILHSVCFGYSSKTKTGLDKYRNTLSELEYDLTQDRIEMMN